MNSRRAVTKMSPRSSPTRWHALYKRHRESESHINTLAIVQETLPRIAQSRRFNIECSMPIITLPDGSQQQFPQPVTVQAVAETIGSRLAKAALAGEVDGRVV